MAFVQSGAVQQPPGEQEPPAEEDLGEQRPPIWTPGGEV
jgi:hypothetical protein